MEIYALLMFCHDAHEHCRLSFSVTVNNSIVSWLCDLVYYGMTTYITETKSSVCLSLLQVRTTMGTVEAQVNRSMDMA